MAGIKFTLEEARQNPASFLYVFADFTVNDRPFLSYIDEKHRRIILGKRANQQKILYNSAKAYLGSLNQYNQYVDAIRTGFAEIYGMDPQEALIRLAAGESVAGKNWDEGVYGVGAIGKKSTFEGVSIDDKAVTVNPETGHIFVGTEDITDTTKTVYKDVKGETVAYQYFSVPGVYTFMSQYNKSDKKYYAKSYSGGDNNGKYSASGLKIGSADAGSIWENINLNWSNVANWIISLLNSLFGINIPSVNSSEWADYSEVDSISAENTLPSQTADGFAQEDGISEAAGILLALVAAGTLLAGGIKKKK